MIDIFARALMTASRCEPLGKIDHRATYRSSSDINQSARSISPYLYYLRKNGIAAKTVMMVRSKRARE